MLELFPDQPVYEYPQLINITYSFLWAFVLACLIAVTHKLTFTGEYYPRNFFQSLVLGAVVTTLVMMAIGDSLARGLGVFGAMAIIRFRTRIDDPRDVLFLFAALSTGLAIGVYGYTISFVGSILFCLVAVLLHFSPFRSDAYHTRLFFTLPNQLALDQVKNVLAIHCREFRSLSVATNKENGYRYQFAISLKAGESKETVLLALGKVEGVTQLRVAAPEIVQDR